MEEENSCRGEDGLRPRLLLLLHHPAEVLSGDIQQPLELVDAILADLPCRIRGLRLIKEALGLLVVRFRDIEGPLQCGFVFQSPVRFHETILNSFAG